MKISRWLIVIFVLVLLCGIIVWWWKSPSSDQAKQKAANKVMPTIGVASTQITDIDDERIKLVSEVTLHNPLPVDINTRRLQYVIYIDSIKVIEDSYEKPISIRSSDSSTITLPMQLLAGPMADVLKHFDSQKVDSANYLIKASFEVDVPIAGERKFTVDVSRRLPALRIPKIRVKHVDLNALALKSKGMDIEVEVVNPNSFPLKMREGKFGFTIEKALEMDGIMEKVIQIPAGGKQDISIHAQVRDGNMLKTGWKMLTDKKGTVFNATFTGMIDSENKMLSDSKMNMKITGTLDEIINTVQKAD